MRLIGIAGTKGSGKDSAADALVASAGYSKFAFATILKAMTRTLLRHLTIDLDTIGRMVDGDLKEMPCPELFGKPARHVMQTLGHEWGRGLIDDQIWVSSCLLNAKTVKRAVISDVRYANEVEAIHAAGGHVVRVLRPTFDGDSHSSESQNFNVDSVLINDGSLEDLQKSILAIEKALYE